MSFARYDGVENDIAVFQNVKARSDILKAIHGPNASPNVTDVEKQCIQRLINSMVSAGNYIPELMVPIMRREGFTLPEGAVVK